MLFTRCPECQTTFRVTDAALQKASGQVRCGRCGTVFNAHSELHDPTAASPDPIAPAMTERAATTTGPSVATVGTEPASSATAGAQSATDAGPRQPPSDAGTEQAADDGAEQAISPEQVDEVLATRVARPAIGFWPPAGVAPARVRTSRWWGLAAALALLALGAQWLHHFRSDIASDPTFGPWIEQAYALLGVELAPNWDVRQYEILDWVATAEPNARGQGSLKITARIQNRGPREQPYPAVHLRLKDRWEEAVGGRVFAPSEYLPKNTPSRELMRPGETARAEIEVVDPGPDAYGFELDVCIEVEANLVTCGTDKVFL